MPIKLKLWLTIGNAWWLVDKAFWMFPIVSTELNVIGPWVIISPTLSSLQGFGTLSERIGIYLVRVALSYNDLVNLYPVWFEITIVKMSGTKILRSSDVSIKMTPKAYVILVYPAMKAPVPMTINFLLNAWFHASSWFYSVRPYNSIWRRALK